MSRIKTPGVVPGTCKALKELAINIIIQRFDSHLPSCKISLDSLQAGGYSD